jgi:hypothetical protein
LKQRLMPHQEKVGFNLKLTTINKGKHYGNNGKSNWIPKFTVR